MFVYFFFFSSRRRHTRCSRDWSSDVCSSDLGRLAADAVAPAQLAQRRTTAQVVGYEEQFLVHGCALLPGHGDRSLAAVGSSCQAWICYPCPCTDVSPMSVSRTDRKSTRLNSSHGYISYAVFCLKKKTART